MRNFLSAFVISFVCLFCSLAGAEESYLVKIVPVKFNPPAIESKTTIKKMLRFSIGSYILDSKIGIKPSPSMNYVAPVRYSSVHDAYLRMVCLGENGYKPITIPTRSVYMGSVHRRAAFRGTYIPLELWNVMLCAPNVSFYKSLQDDSNFFVSRRCRLLEVYERLARGETDLEFVVTELRMEPEYSEEYVIYKSPTYDKSFRPTEDDIYDLKMDIIFARLNLEWIIDKSPFMLVTPK